MTGIKTAGNECVVNVYMHYIKSTNKLDFNEWGDSQSACKEAPY